MNTDEVRLPQLHTLTWRDVDPAARPGFEPARVAELVRTLPPAAGIPAAGADWRLVSFWYARMTAALVERLGDWVVGWECTIEMQEFQDLGVVPVWLYYRPPVTTPDETLARLSEAVVTWHQLLVELATDARGRFATLAPAARDDTSGPPAWRAVTANRVGRSLEPHPARRLPHPNELTWAQHDPAGRVFDPATVPAVVTALVAVAELPKRRQTDWRLIDLWVENVTAGLVDRYGLWAVGWQWAVGESDLDGGPVTSYCCFSHSAITPEETAARIAAALVEWHDWLVELAGRFDRFLPLPAGDLDGWERAVAHLVTAVGERTRYESAWYSCCQATLGWFLDASGIEESRREDLIDHAVAGRFDSWTEPSDTVVGSVAADLARRVVVDPA